MFLRELLLLLVPLLAVSYQLGLNGRRKSLVRLYAQEDNIPSTIEESPFTGQGCVLVASPNEYSHLFMKAAIFIYNHNSEGTQGVIVDRPTAFTMGETAPSIGVFEGNTLYMGGEDGGDLAIMFHKYTLNGSSKYIGGGVYTGGLREAKEMVTERKAHPLDFKFVFNNIEWGVGQVENEIKQGKWRVVTVPPDLILKQTANQSLWSTINKALK